MSTTIFGKFLKLGENFKMLANTLKISRILTYHFAKILEEILKCRS